MPRRRLLTATERESLLAFPTTDDELIRHYMFSEPELAVIGQRRGTHNRLGFAVQLCYLRYPGITLPTDARPPLALLALIGQQLGIEPDIWPRYAQRPETRREHLAELQAWLNLSPFSLVDYRRLSHPIAELARQTDRGLVLAQALVETRLEVVPWSGCASRQVRRGPNIFWFTSHGCKAFASWTYRPDWNTPFTRIAC